MKRPLTWAYGVTTVPFRKDTLLPRTLASLSKAGFPGPRLFVDGANDRDEESYVKYNLPTTFRWPAIRAYGNWILGLAELYIREPLAERYALFQDDLIASAGLREYLNACKYPEKGYWNLYTFPQNQELAPEGGKKAGWYPSNQRGRSALALVFDHEATVQLLTHPHMILKPQDNHKGHRNIDGAVITSLQLKGYTEWVHNPSLVQHTGVESTVGNKQWPDATSFRGEDFDARRLLEEIPCSATP